MIYYVGSTQKVVNLESISYFKTSMDFPGTLIQNGLIKRPAIVDRFFICIFNLIFFFAYPIHKQTVLIKTLKKSKSETKINLFVHQGIF